MTKYMHHNSNTRHSDGYILLYVVLAITLFTGLVSTVVQSTVTEVELGAQELDAVKALAAADAAMECFSYWMHKPSYPFNTNTPSIPFTCAVGSDNSYSSTSPKNRSTQPADNGKCKPNTEKGTASYNKAYAYEISGYDSGSCVRVTVEIKPQTVEGVSDFSANTPLCATRVRAEGYAGACGDGSPSYSQWKTVSGWKDKLTLKGDEPDLESQTIPEGGGLTADVEPYAFMNVEVSGSSNTRHVSSPIEISVTYTGTPPTPLGEMVGFKLVDDSALIDALLGQGGAGHNNEEVKVEFKDGEGNEEQATEFGDATTMRVSVPGNTPVGFYRLAVRAKVPAYDNSPELYYEDVMVYLNVFKAGSGQGE